MSLSFDTLRYANLNRLPLFRDAKGNLCHNSDGSDWSFADWYLAASGEMGELANLLKKVKRGDFTLEEKKQEISDELADIIIYLDILAARLEVRLDDAIQKKFNEVSRRVKAPVFIYIDILDSGESWVTKEEGKPTAV